MDGFDIELPCDNAADVATKKVEEKSYVPADQLGLANTTGEASYLSVFDTENARKLVGRFVKNVVSSAKEPAAADDAGASIGLEDAEQQEHAIRIASAAFNGFLQANVTGPVLEGAAKCDQIFSSAFKDLAAETRLKAKKGQSNIDVLRRICSRSLDIDGVSVYSYIPHIELFCFAKWVLTSGNMTLKSSAQHADEFARDVAWLQFRIHLWHYKLLSQPSLGPGSLFTKSGRWTDVATLQESIEESMDEAERRVFVEDGEAPKDAKVQFLLEKANAHLMLGHDPKAKQALQQATETSGLVYALSGALGKRTKFQEKSTSQLVVLAKSSGLGSPNEDSKDTAPSGLPLNDDTLLEKISFTNDSVEDLSTSTLPEALQGLTPETQPKLKAEDQIILLTEATLKDTFSPADSLTSEEILPFAVRVIEDKSTNWQIYTQALLVRSRIELNRSRTIERGVLQMQAVVDQVIVDTDATASSLKTSDPSTADGGQSVPEIAVSGADDEARADEPAKATSFFPVAKPSESASSQVRLRYVHALASPPRWHLESELAFAWTSVGSLISALEIFKRLRLWPEVALCLATTANTDDPDGRGSGGEQKAKAIVRWRLFHRTDKSSETDDDEDDDRMPDTDDLRAKDYDGAERDPPPPNAPRLWCILGDMESEPKHYERAWEISKHRYGRAQKSLGELYLQQKDWENANKAYKLAVSVNRLSPDLWGRLGDINLRLGNFPDATEAFQRAIGASSGEEGGEGARTWSNLGTALLSWYKQIAKESKGLKEKEKNILNGDEDDDDERGSRASAAATNDHVNPDEMPATARAAELNKPAYRLIQDALTAFKRGATISQTNWRIWDNVVTLAASISPKPALDDMIQGTRNVIRIQACEEALDAEVLGMLVREVSKEAPLAQDREVYEAPRASFEYKVIAMFENEVVPLITTNSEIWSLVSRLRAWRRDFAGALEAAEKGWRAALGSTASSSLSAPTSGAATGKGNGNWLSGEDKEAWETVITRTGDLVAAYENWGPEVESIGEQRWRGKARSALRSVMGKGKESWEGSEGWNILASLMEGLKV